MNATYIICGTLSHFTDDRRIKCVDCSLTLAFRPHFPPDAIKICTNCFTQKFKDSDMPFRVELTERARKEAGQFYKCKLS